MVLHLHLHLSLFGFIPKSFWYDIHYDSSSIEKVKQQHDRAQNISQTMEKNSNINDCTIEMFSTVI